MSYGEHDIIETELDLFREGHYIPAESSGVIVGVASESDGAYYVEFCNLKYNPVVLCFDHEFSEAINQ